MDIMAVNDERFGQLERSVSNELARIGPELIMERPDAGHRAESPKGLRKGEARHGRTQVPRMAE